MVWVVLGLLVMSPLPVLGLLGCIAFVRHRWSAYQAAEEMGRPAQIIAFPGVKPRQIPSAVSRKALNASRAGRRRAA